MRTSHNNPRKIRPETIFERSAEDPLPLILHPGTQDLVLRSPIRVTNRPPSQRRYPSADFHDAHGVSYHLHPPRNTILLKTSATSGRGGKRRHHHKSDCNMLRSEQTDDPRCAQVSADVWLFPEKPHIRNPLHAFSRTRPAPDGEAERRRDQPQGHPDDRRLLPGSGRAVGLLEHRKADQGEPREAVSTVAGRIRKQHPDARISVY